VTVYISSFARRQRCRTFALIVLLFASAIFAKGQPQTVRVAVLDLGSSTTGAHAGNAIRQTFRVKLSRQKKRQQSGFIRLKFRTFDDPVSTRCRNLQKRGDLAHSLVVCAVHS